MSLDNGVFILILKSENPNYEYEYRVAHAHAMENIFQDPDTLIETFQNSNIHYDQRTAKNEATKIDYLEATEYGVAILNQFTEYTWSDIANITGVIW